MIVNFAAAMRRRSAFALCREYGVSAAEIVPLLGLTEDQFLRALKRDGLSYSDMQQGNRQLRLARRIMDLLKKELDTLSSLDKYATGKPAVASCPADHGSVEKGTGYAFLTG